MKKLFLLLLPGMVFLAGSAHAQLQKGTKYWGASISLNGSGAHSEALPPSENDNNTHIIAPSIQTGWFIKDNLMFGLGLNTALTFNKVKSKSPDFDLDYTARTLSVNFSPFLRRYKSINDKWAIFLQTSLNGAYLRRKSESPSGDDHENGYAIGAYVMPGISYWVTPRFVLESDINVLSLNLNYINMDDASKVYFQAGVTSGIQGYFGIRAAWYLQQSN